MNPVTRGIPDEAAGGFGRQACGSVHAILELAVYQLADLISWCSYVAEAKVEEWINSFCTPIASTAHFTAGRPETGDFNYVDISMLCNESR